MKSKWQYNIIFIFFLFLPKTGLSKYDVYIAPYSGQYLIELHNINNPSYGIVNAYGTMTYDLNQDCLGWIAHTSIFMDIYYEDGSSNTLISNLSSYESFDGWHYSFAFQNYNEIDETLVYTGNVSFPNKQDYAIVSYNEPKAQPPITLPLSTLFPVSLYKNIIRAGDENIAHFTAPYFDGSIPTEIHNVSIFITSILNSSNNNIKGDVDLFENMPTIETSMAFFSQNENTIPNFESRFSIFKNGILKEMIQTIGPIDAKVSLQEIKKIIPKECTINN